MNRYTPNNFGFLIPDQDGAWIRHSDVAALERKIAELEAAATINERALIEATRKLTSIEPSAQSPGIDAVKVRPSEFAIGDRVVTTDSFNRTGTIQRIFVEMTKAFNVVGDNGQGGMYGSWEIEHEHPLPSQPEPLGQAIDEHAEFEKWYSSLAALQGNWVDPSGEIKPLVWPAEYFHKEEVFVDGVFTSRYQQEHIERSWTAWNARALLHKAGASGLDATNSGEVK